MKTWPGCVGTLIITVTNLGRLIFNKGWEENSAPIYGTFCTMELLLATILCFWSRSRKLFRCLVYVDLRRFISRLLINGSVVRVHARSLARPPNAYCSPHEKSRNSMHTSGFMADRGRIFRLDACCCNGRPLPVRPKPHPSQHVHASDQLRKYHSPSFPSNA